MRSAGRRGYHRATAAKRGRRRITEYDREQKRKWEAERTQKKLDVTGVSRLDDEPRDSHPQAREWPRVEEGPRSARDQERLEGQARERRVHEYEARRTRDQEREDARGRLAESGYYDNHDSTQKYIRRGGRQ